TIMELEGKMVQLENEKGEQCKIKLELEDHHNNLQQEHKKLKEDFNSTAERLAEIEKLSHEQQKRIMELKVSLEEESLSENQKLLESSKRQLHGIKQENAELDKQVFTLKIQLDQATEQYRHASLSVQEVLYGC
ncbi:6774_t:CDS:2, partial [Acaulospora morrowiae]